MRLAPLSISEPQEAKRFDEAMAGFFRHLLCFPGQEEYGEHGDVYGRAIPQLRLPIKEGGWGLSSAETTAACALYGGVGSFVSWYKRFRALSGAADRGVCVTCV